MALISCFVISLFSSRNWRDPSWVGIFSVQNGVDEATRVQRLILFGKNEIDIKGKSTMSLLVDEVTFVITLLATMINIFYRLFILSTYFKLLVSFCGALTITTTMHFASVLYLPQA